MFRGKSRLSPCISCMPVKSSRSSPHATSPELSVSTLFIFYSRVHRTLFRVVFPYVLLDGAIHSVCDVLSPLCWVPTSHRRLLVFTAVLFLSSKALNSSVKGDPSYYSKMHVQTKRNNVQIFTLQLFYSKQILKPNIFFFKNGFNTFIISFDVVYFIPST